MKIQSQLNVDFIYFCMYIYVYACVWCACGGVHMFESACRGQKAIFNLFLGHCLFEAWSVWSSPSRVSRLIGQ